MLIILWTEEFVWIRQIDVAQHIEERQNHSTKKTENYSQTKIVYQTKIKSPNETREHASKSGKEPRTTSSQSLHRSKSSKHVVILLWNPKYRRSSGMNRELSAYCPRLKCKMTPDKRLIGRADAVVFEGETLDKVPVPPRKQTGQIWVYSMKESAEWSPIPEKWDHVFNYTMTYRRDSDILMTYSALAPNVRKNRRVFRRLGNYLKRSNKGLLWFVSHCHTPGKREKFIADLKTYFPVDTVGACGVVTTMQNVKKNLLNKEYNFYFSGENANCRDYITEKAFRIMRNFNALPVVRGGANYSIFLPSHSFVDTRMFTNVSELGVFLSDLQRDTELFNDYFSWRRHYKVRGDKVYCELCRKLRSQDKKRRVYRSIDNWWRGHEQKSGKFCFQK